MANDLIFLRCTECKQAAFLAKSMSQGWYRKDADGETEQARKAGDVLLRFLDEHQWCGDTQGGSTMSPTVVLAHDEVPSSELAEGEWWKAECAVEARSPICDL